MEPSADPFDWDRIRTLILTELEPRRLAERIANDRRDNPNYHWTSLGFYQWRRDEMAEAEFNQKVKSTIARIHADPATSAALERLEGLGFRYLMEVIPLDASIVKGSHGRPPATADEGPLAMTNRRDLLGVAPGETLPATGVFDLILRHLTAG